MRTSPPITAPMIAPVIGFLSIVVTFDIELDEPPDGTLVEIGVLLEEVEDVAFS